MFTMNGAVFSGVRKVAVLGHTLNIWIIDVGVLRLIRVPSGWIDMAPNEPLALDG